MECGGRTTQCWKIHRYNGQGRQGIVHFKLLREEYWAVTQCVNESTRHGRLGQQPAPREERLLDLILLPESLA